MSFFPLSFFPFFLALQAGFTPGAKGELYKDIKAAARKTVLRRFKVCLLRGVVVTGGTLTLSPSRWGEGFQGRSFFTSWPGNPKTTTCLFMVVLIGWWSKPLLEKNGCFTKYPFKTGCWGFHVVFVILLGGTDDVGDDCYSPSNRLNNSPNKTTFSFFWPVCPTYTPKV